MKTQKTEYEDHVQERLDVIYKKWGDNNQWEIHEFLSNLMPHSRTLVRVSHMNLAVISEGLHFWNAKGFFAYAIPVEYLSLFNFGEDFDRWTFRTSVYQTDNLLSDLRMMKEMSGLGFIDKIIEILEKSILLFKAIPAKNEVEAYNKYLDRMAALEEEYFDIITDDQKTEPLLFEALWKTYQKKEDEFNATKTQQ